MILFQRNSQSIAVFSAKELQTQIAETVIQLRKEKGFTQIDMAKDFGMSQTAYAKIEKGNTKIDIEKLFIFCEVLQVTLVHLLGLDKVISTEAHKKISELEQTIIQQKNTMSEKDMLINLMREKLKSVGINF